MSRRHGRLGAPAAARGACLIRGFTLFELILAITLSAALLALISTAINLYLIRVDASRTRIEEAQLARSVMAMVADDLRAAFVYEPQDTSGVADLAANAASFDVDSIDAPNSPGSPGSSGTAGSAASSTSSTGGASLGASGEPEGVLPLGVNGTPGELIVDVSRLPRLDEPLAVASVNTAAATGAMADTAQTPRISDVKTIRYFVRQGDELSPSSPAATSLSPDGQARAGGLVRQEIDRAVRTWAEQSGNQTLLETAGMSLVAHEVVQVEFRYFDGSEVFDRWDMQEMGCLPVAIEVRIWIASADAAAAQTAMQFGLTNLEGKDQYWQTVYLPLSGLSSAGAAGSSSSTSESTSTSESSSTTTGTSTGNSLDTTGGTGR